MMLESNLFRGVIKLKTLCVGGQFVQSELTDDSAVESLFPINVLQHTNVFKFFIENNFSKALDIVYQNQDIDLVFVDADYDPLSELVMFITQIREFRPKLPIVIFTSSTDDKMRHLMREGATWHFIKHSTNLNRLVEQIQSHVFSPIDWDEIFERYEDALLKPRIEPGLSYADLEALKQNPEERYIIKRLFAGSEVVQIFRMDQGFSGSRIYTVKPEHQLKRILKIDMTDRVEAVQEKQERLIQPRLNRRIGQLQGKLVRGEHLAGTCYSLAGSNHDTMTLTQFLQDQNRVRKDMIVNVLKQLRESLDQLYAGSSDTELRYWAPLYSRVLPPYLVLEDVELVTSGQMQNEGVAHMVSAQDLTTLSAVPGNATLQDINKVVRNGETPTIILEGFEVAEIDTRAGVLYLHDDLVVRHPISSLLKDKDHPILRFKLQLKESERRMLTHPVFRRGKRITVRGRVTATQETILAAKIGDITGEAFDFDSDLFKFASGRFISPITNIRYLLWELGREDMIVPIPQLSPVVHGDLNTSNILVEVTDDIPVWLIDFSDARPGHIYFDLAKLEVEFRTHVFYRLFKEMVDEGIWDMQTATQFALLVESVLLETVDGKFEDFIAGLRDYQPEWYDNLYTHFPLYSENLLYFLHSLRRIAKTYSPERFRHHFPVAVFFHSIAALKFDSLEDAPWNPWAKRLALCCALVSGKRAVRDVERPLTLAKAVGNLRQRSSFALISVGIGEDRKYLLQWNANWGMFNLVGGKMDNEKEDRDSFARTIQRELKEELGIQSPKDYRLIKEYKPLQRRQFSRRQFVFKEYEFRVFQIELMPRHPMTREEFDLFGQRFSSDRENILVSKAEIERLRTVSNRPISETTRMILQDLGEITASDDQDLFTPLAFELETENMIVSRGRAQVCGQLLNPRFGNLIENVTLEVLASAAYETERDSAVIQIGTLDAGQCEDVALWLRPKEAQGSLMLRATYYDVRGHEYRQLLEKKIQFDAPLRSLSHVENPYVVGKPLTPASESLYMGREDVFSWVEENLLGKTQPNALILYGQRRMGKTSTLYQLVGGMRGRTIREYPNHPIFPVYIDLQRLAGRNTRAFFEQLSHQIGRSLAKRDIQLSIPTEWSSNGTIFNDFDAFLDQVENSLPSNGLLVLVIDELEQLQDSVERGKLTQDIFPYLRSLMQHRPKMTFILAGTNQLVEEYWSIIFHVGISREITSLTREETENLIRDPVSPMIQYDDLAVDRIWLATRGHPYFTQLICHRLISDVNLGERRDRSITITHVRETIKTVIEEDDSHLKHLWHECSRDEQLVMAALAGRQEMGEVTVSRSEIVSRLRDTPFNDELLMEALKRLKRRGLLRRTPVEREIHRRLIQPGGWQPTLVSKDYMYSLSFELLQNWVAQKRPLGSILS